MPYLELLKLENSYQLFFTYVKLDQKINYHVPH